MKSKKIKRKEFENYFVYGNLKICNACDPLTGTLVVGKLKCDFWNDLKYISRGQDVVAVKKWPKRGGKLMLAPRLPPVNHVGFFFLKLKIKWTSNLSVSFQLKIIILVSFEKYSNSKCNSLSKS